MSIGNSSDWEISVNEHRVLLRCRNEEENKKTGWKVLSSAVLNGGLRAFDSSSDLLILNTKVPADYNGVDPDPQVLLEQMIQKEENIAEKPTARKTETVGMMTAASMKTVRIATHRSGPIVVDVIVTAGISNSRTAGAPADFICFPSNSSGQESESKKKPDSSIPPPGTVNTIILTNISINESTLMEAYAVAIEAKCKVFAELGIPCRKTGKLAQGTGTDVTLLVTRASEDMRVQHAGKHTLFGELIGQAVYEATRDAVQTNLDLLSPFGSRLSYHLQSCWTALVEGHRPWVPSQPMKGIPGPEGWTLFVGVVGVLLSILFHTWSSGEPETSPNLASRLPSLPSVSILFGVIFWDRYLGSFLQPVSMHPVVLVGKLIKFSLKILPEICFDIQQPLFGLTSSCLLFVSTLSISLIGSWFLLIAVPTLTRMLALNAGLNEATEFVFQIWNKVGPSLAWFIHVFLVKGSLSLQLLCNIALQMAHFLERKQIQQSRNQLCWLCSRDPSELQVDELAGATLESLAENLSDSFVSPLFWYVFLGPVGAFGFRVINTLDSCVGFRGGRFEYVGKVSARCDDLANIIPARLTTVFLVLAALLSRDYQGAKNGISVAWRDASQCDSPNAGWPMGTMAGILNIRLDKRNCYCLNRGRGSRSPCAKDIYRGHSIALTAGCLAFLFAIGASSLLHGSAFWM